jgi:DNA-directed RNA polymerase specialized sigma24 family protein
MDENQLLQQLVAQAQSHPDRSAKRRIALTKLITKIRQSPSLKKANNYSNIKNYQDIYDEALNETCLEICRRIGDYQSDSPVMAWVNNTLKYRQLDVQNRYLRKGITNIARGVMIIWQTDSSGDANNENTSRKLEIVAPDTGDPDRKSLKDFIAEDPDRVFATKHIKNLPEATFQKILLLICEDKSWKEIAEHLGTSVSTASSFYQRNLDESLEYLQQSLR